MEEEKFSKKIIIIGLCIMFLILGIGITAGVIAYRRSKKPESKDISPQITPKPSPKKEEPAPNPLKNTPVEPLEETSITKEESQVNDGETIAETVQKLVSENMSLVKDFYQGNLTNIFKNIKEFLIKNDVSEEDIKDLDDLVEDDEGIKVLTNE